MRFGVLALCACGIMGPTVEAAAETRSVTVHYRVIYDQISQPFPVGRPHWGETVAVRLSVDDAGAILVEGATSRTVRDAIPAHRRNGETVDAGGYKVTYSITPDAWTIRSDYPSLTLTRTVRFTGAGTCVATVDYAQHGGGVLVMPTAGDPNATFASIRAKDATCAVESAGVAAATALKSTCDIDPSGSPEIRMTVSQGAMCGWRPRQGVFRHRLTLVDPPRHGSIEMRGQFVNYMPTPGYAGPDAFVVRGTPAIDTSPERHIQVQVVR